MSTILIIIVVLLLLGGGISAPLWPHGGFGHGWVPSGSLVGLLIVFVIVLALTGRL